MEMLHFTEYTEIIYFIEYSEIIHFTEYTEIIHFTEYVGTLTQHCQSPRFCLKFVVPKTSNGARRRDQFMSGSSV
jgi:hypothetical protein